MTGSTNAIKVNVADATLQMRDVHPDLGGGAEGVRFNAAAVSDIKDCNFRGVFQALNLSGTKLQASSHLTSTPLRLSIAPERRSFSST